MGSQQQWQHNTGHLDSRTSWLWAASSGTFGFIITTFWGSHLCQLFLCRNKRTVSSSGSTILAIWTAEPVGFWAASSGTFGFIITTLWGSHLCQFFLSRNSRTVSSCGSTVLAIWTADPVGFWAASSGTFGFI